ncbi:hypothetical protein LTR37_003215 [Vermiconidia calcicola]|uniref:Uncharacterized protein n=1 Tax=Vermiconidia calcicola TaxID=1690605 RepID=A0ACC3NQZ9_9PEZI|nr:hypothetical protein LTR37_003215 [Vermiconidia calcicola]
MHKSVPGKRRISVSASSGLRITREGIPVSISTTFSEPLPSTTPNMDSRSPHVSWRGSRRILPVNPNPFATPNEGSFRPCMDYDLDDRRASVDHHPLFTPNDTHSLPAPSPAWHRTGNLPPERSIRSNYATFGDYDDDEGREMIFKIDLPIASPLARARAARRGETVQDVLRRQFPDLPWQWHTPVREEFQLDVKMNFRILDWNPTHKKIKGEHKHAYNDVSPKSFFPRSPCSTGVSSRREKDDFPRSPYPADVNMDVLFDADTAAVENEQARTARAITVKKITAGTARRTLLTREHRHFLAYESPEEDLIDLFSPLAECGENLADVAELTIPMMDMKLDDVDDGFVDVDSFARTDERPTMRPEDEVGICDDKSKDELHCEVDDLFGGMVEYM